MKKNSTIDLTAPCIEPRRMKPKAATLNAVMQFARIYSYEAHMPKGLGAFIAN